MKDDSPGTVPGNPRGSRAPFDRDGRPLDPILRDHDWRGTALGDPAGWPLALRTAAALVLDAPVPTWLAWGDELALMYNARFARLLGESHPAALGAPLRELGVAARPAFARLAADALEGRGGVQEDLLLWPGAQDGDAGAWFTLSSTPLRDVDGAVRGLVCSVWESPGPQRRDAGQATSVRGDAWRHEIEERYRLAGLASNDAIWDWRLADGQVVWNRALTTLFGHRQEVTSAEWWLEHIHPEDRARIDASIHAVIEGGANSWSDAYRFRRSDGSYAEIYDRGTVLRDADGVALRMIGAMLDLSQQRAAEAALRESERLFRTLFESIDEGFCVIEFLDGLHGPLSDYVHVMANPAYAHHTGIHGVVGQRVRDMVPQEAEGWVRIYRKVLETGEPVRFERELEHTGRYLELSALRIEPPERRQVAVLFQDVSERHRAERLMREVNDTLERRVAEEVAERTRTEAALRQSQKMEAVGQLTGGIAHDFNNMLAVILNSLELLDRRFIAGDERARRYVDAAKGSVRRAAQLTQRLLAFSRQQPLKPQSVTANRLVSGMSELFAHALGGDVRLETVLAAGLWTTRVDPNQLENAILNLAVNGRDAMPEGGRLTIETANCHLDERYAAEHPGLVPGQYVMIAVSDTGGGMPPDVVARAFDPFFTTKEVGRGTGLGLSQVYGFVKQSGGHVKIYSEVGQGTVVKVYLPRQLEVVDDEAPPIAPARMPHGDPGEVVLVVEDEDAVRQLTVDMLTELGYRVLHAESAAAALRLIDAHPEISLLFTDVVMPEVNGRRLAEAARKRRPGLRVLFTTGYPRNAVVHNGVLEPGVQLIGKPFSIEEVAGRLREVLDGFAPLGP
ncbi:MAG: PAS domain S-box protein [Lautropia sp.]